MNPAQLAWPRIGMSPRCLLSAAGTGIQSWAFPHQFTALQGSHGFQPQKRRCSTGIR
jgi:hypothetical protein